MTDKKIEILQDENGRLRRALEQVRHLTSDGIAQYVDDYERSNRELLIELRELRENYRKEVEKAGKMVKELRGIWKVEKSGRFRRWKLWKKRGFGKR